MPSLHIFGRRWSISSDDFVFPEITEAWIRFLWLVASLVIYLVRAKSEACFELHLFVIVSLVTNCVVITLALATAYVSSLGTILNGTPRRRLPILIYVRCPLIVFEVIWNILGSIWLHQSDKSVCDPAFVWGVTVAVLGGWLMLLVLLIGVYMNFDPTGRIHHADVKLTDEAKKVWKSRVRVAFICASRSDKAKIAFEDVAELFTDLFADTDLVWTDVWAAMLLLANKELTVLNERARRLIEGDPPPWMNIKAAARMMDFALGIYGWPYYMCGRGCSLTAMCDLIKRGRCCGNCRCDSAIVIKDNCCMCNTAALLLQTGMAETDLFYVNLHNEIWETPFIACFDHSSKAIVIAIRGSLSMRDAITDLCACDDTLELNSCTVGSNGVIQPPGVGANGIQPNSVDTVPYVNGSPDHAELCIKCRVHKGMLLSARYVASKLDNEHILEDMFVLQPTYDLILTGHSLGAGVACLVGILLKPRYPKLICYALSPPGCVISDEGVEFTKSFVFSVAIADDCVPRLSIQSMKALKQNVLDILNNCDRPKFEILLKGCFKLLCGGMTAPRPRRRPPSTAGAEHTIVVDEDDSPLLSPLRRRAAAQYTEENDVTGSAAANVQLRCPGRIMHIQKSLTTTNNQLTFVTRWVHHSYFSDIRMSSSMVSDHMPWTVSKVLKSFPEYEHIL